MKSSTAEGAVALRPRSLVWWLAGEGRLPQPNRFGRSLPPWWDGWRTMRVHGVSRRLILAAALQRRRAGGRLRRGEL